MILNIALFNYKNSIKINFKLCMIMLQTVINHLGSSPFYKVQIFCVINNSSCICIFIINFSFISVETGYIKNICLLILYFNKVKSLFFVQFMPIKAQTSLLNLVYENIIYYIFIILANELCWRTSV